MSDATPVMGADERTESRALSLDSLRPPLRVPGYEQERFLGRGSFGEVWVAVDSNSGRTVAIKYYNRKGSVDWALLAREVEKLQHLFSDRHVVQLLAVGWNADPPYYVMEYMAAGSLEDRLKDGPMAVDEAVGMIREIAQGLVHAHGKGILHCDLKPGNVLLDQDGRPRLADFGQARLAHEQAPSLGTLFYMAPEQADLHGVPDARWDVYALGALLYCMLTGSPPFRDADAREGEILRAATLAERLEAYRRVLNESPRPAAHRQAPGMDAALAQIIDRCLAVDPKRRYANVQAVLDALDARALKRARLPLLVLGAAAPALVLLVMALAGWWLFGKTVRTASDEVLRQAAQGNRFAARAVADRFALEIDKRWRLLEREAADPEFVRRLGQIAAAPADSPAWREQRRWLQGWLDRRSQANDDLFSPATSATSWFANDRAGVQVARTPADRSIGKSWAFRDYFHGQNKEYPEGTPAAPLRRPHRSLVFRSTVTDKLTVAFSVPVWGGEPRVGDPVGVLAMTSQLGKFTEWEDSPGQNALLVDTLPVQTRNGEPGKPGMIVEHSNLARFEPARDTPGTDWYVAAEVVDRAARLAARKFRDLRRRMGPPEEARPPDTDDEAAPEDYRGGFRDPLEPDVKEWLAAVEPVLVAHGRGDVLDSGWAVVIERKTADVLAPVDDLRGTLVAAALIAHLVVLVLVAGLWWFVAVVLDQSADSPLIRNLRKRLGLSSGGLRSGSGSSGSLPRSEPTPHRPAEPPTVLSSDKPIETREGP